MINLALVTGVQEVNQLNFALNAVIQAINGNSAGTLNSQVGSIGNAADTTDDTTFQYLFNIGAWSSFAVGAGIRVTAWGTVAANGNNKTWKIFFGTTTVISSGVVIINAKNWIARATVIRSGVSTQKVLGETVSDAAVISTNVADATESEAANITLKVTNASPTTGAAADVLTKGFTVEALR